MILIGARMIKAFPNIKLEERIPVFTATSISEEIRTVGQARFNERATEIARDVRFVNFICDAGTVQRIKVVHSGLTNPSALSDFLPLLPRPNTNYDAAKYEAFFREHITELLVRFPRIEICGIICDNLPAQVAGLHAFLESDPRWHRIMHIPCLNHMTNLVFTYALKYEPIAEFMSVLPEIIHALSSSDAKQLLGRKCPKIIRTRCVYLVDVLGFILNHFTCVQTVLHLADAPLISLTSIQLQSLE
jgi:hypothetical protein